MARLDTHTIRTERPDFDVTFSKLVTFMRAKTNKRIDDQYYERIRFYPVEAFTWAVDKHIDENRPTAGNFPTPADLANACASWLNYRPKIKHSFTIYDHFEDYDFPLEFLHEAFKILCDRGKEACAKYCQQMRMPKNDRERVVMKYNAVMARKSVVVEVDKLIAAIVGAR